MASCENVKLIQQTPLIRAYLTPSNIYHIPDLEEVLNHFLWKDPIFMGDLNTDVGQTGKPLYPAGGRLPGIFQDGRPLSLPQATYEVPE